MKGRAFRPGLAASLLLAFAACGGGEEEEAGEPIAPADLLGYYTFADPIRGVFHVALLEENRFLLVMEPAEAAGPAEAVEPVTDREGVAGWYIVRGDSLYLNSEDMYARGVVTLDVLRLEFTDPPGEATEAEPFPVTFERATGKQEGGEKGGGGGQGEGDGGS